LLTREISIQPPKKMKPAVIILTFNSSSTLAQTIESAGKVSDEIYVVDSFSQDNTISLAESLGARVLSHAFENYGKQRNWAIENTQSSSGWQLHLDADERMDETLCAAISALPEDPVASGFLLARNLVFLRRQLRHGGMSPTWHLRLFRSGIGRCEDRLYDQHFFLQSGKAYKLPGMMLDDIRMSLSEWTARHNRWSDAEVEEIAATMGSGQIQPRLFGSTIERKRRLRGLYYSAPLLVRPFALFFYRYFLRLGFLDGVEGLIFWVLQTFWFRFLIDAKLCERRKTSCS
jgi:glycosyltransferase involved in cell wall biosynthesis